MLSHVWMPIQVVDDVGAAALCLRLGLQLLVEVGMTLQVRVDGITHGLIARGRVGHRQRDQRRGRAVNSPPARMLLNVVLMRRENTRGSYARPVRECGKRWVYPLAACSRLISSAMSMSWSS